MREIAPVTPESVDMTIRRFAEFLRSAWRSATVLIAGQAEEGQAIWVQANWELLVETTLEHCLYPYNGGADLHADSSRVTIPEAEATHAIACTPAFSEAIDVLTGVAVEFPKGGFLFEEFVSVSGGHYSRQPPFDFVRVNTYETEYVFRSSDLKFALREFLEHER